MAETKTTTPSVDFSILQVDTTQYSLEDDQNLFSVLTSFSNYVTERTTSIQREVNETSEAAKRLDVQIGNAFNDFLRLANTQFIENRVYEEDETENNSNESKENQDKTNSSSAGTEDESSVVNRYKHALTTGFKAMNLFLYDEDDLSDEEEEEDEEEEGGDGEKKIKTKHNHQIIPEDDVYNERPLPYCIGSPLFLESASVIPGAKSDDESSSRFSGSDDDGHGSESSGGEDENENDYDRPPRRDDRSEYSQSEGGESDYTDEDGSDGGGSGRQRRASSSRRGKGGAPPPPPSAHRERCACFLFLFLFLFLSFFFLLSL